MENPARKLADLLEAWTTDGATTTESNLLRLRTRQGEKIGGGWSDAIMMAVTLLSDCDRAIERMEQAGYDCASFRVARHAWVKAIIQPDVSWGTSGTAKTEVISNEGLAHLKSLGAYIDLFNSRSEKAFDVNRDALRRLCNEVEEMIAAPEVPQVFRSYVVTLIKGLRDVLEGDDVSAIVDETLKLLGALNFAGVAEPDKPWAQKMRDFATNASASLVAGGAIEATKFLALTAQ